MLTLQRGQALPLGLALILFAALGGLVLYNVGQTATDKARLVNTADAAAYSGVQYQARALNFQAYTNRAMVANQVSMAQAVTLESWTTYGKIMSQNLETVLSGVPFVNAVAAGVSTVMDGIDRVVSPIAGAMLSVIDTINGGIAIAQEAMFLSSFAATPEIVVAVVEANDPRFTAETAYSMLGALGNLADWSAFTAEVGTGTEDYPHMRERAAMIEASQDPFTRERDWSFFNGYLYIAPGVKIDIKKEGRTRLVEREGDDGLDWEWKAKDTQSFHTKINLIFDREHIEVPIGYGGAFANSADDEEDTIEPGACDGYESLWQDCATMLDDNELAESFVDANVPDLQGDDSLIPMNDRYSGLRTFRRLSDGARDESFPTLRLRVEVALPLADARSSQGLVTGDTFDTPLVARGDLLSSISIAEVFFKPPDADRWLPGDILEFANAYSPWWDTRLAPIGMEERLAAFALRERGSTVPDGGSRVPDLASGETSLTDIPASGGAAGEQGGEASAVSGDDILALFGGTGDPHTDNYAELLASGRSLDAGDLVAAAAERYGEEQLEQVLDEIEEELEEALAEAVENILAGIARQALESEAGQRAVAAYEVAETAVDLIDDAIDIDAVQNDIEVAVADVRDMQQEFRELDEMLAREFAPFFRNEVNGWIGEYGGRQRQLANDAGNGYGRFGVPNAYQVDETLRPYVDEVRQGRRELVETLSIEYARLVNEATDRFELEPRGARQIVNMLLRAYEDTDGGVVDFSLFGDIDMPLPETPEPGGDEDIDEGDTTGENTDG